jgi:hypothetical protein
MVSSTSIENSDNPYSCTRYTDMILIFEAAEHVLAKESSVTNSVPSVDDAFVSDWCASGRHRDRL